MENLNAEQIVKALVCISGEEVMFCRECRYNGVGAFSCRKELAKDALSLIKKLTEENERLHESCTEFERKCASLNDENERLRAENETLKVATNEQYAHLCDCYDNIAEMLRQKEAHTVMKMYSMLCEGRVSNDTVVIVANQIAKEMLEGEDER